MGRILALDYGRKRTGIAVTDNLQLIANGLDTVPTYQLFSFLESYFKAEKVEKVIIGYPIQMNNKPSESVVFVDSFLKKFRKQFPDISIETVDERFTSKMAFQAMIDGGLKKKQRQDKAMVDKISAVIILQTFLESKQNFL
ncbi:MAG: Holliday junction resolvase RuvX [Bacteroidales bacterium]|nr:Holliday junction resolvase RuvX [Bacteroidales bacterium]MBN2817769.1 Holliday junction resolvase RuvX [Bacteroidales bacterium]